MQNECRWSQDRLMTKRDDGQTKKLHDINWDTFDHASNAPHSRLRTTLSFSWNIWRKIWYLNYSLCPCTSLFICDRIWQKGQFRAVAEFLFLIAHIFKAVIATVLKPGMVIPQSLLHTRWKFCAPPISGTGVAITSTARGRKSAVLCLTLELHHFR